MARKKRSLPEINAGSMADIAFLLLIFFLVTTSIDSDKGIPISLPPPLDPSAEPPKVKERNVLEVLINSNDQLLVELKPMSIEELCDKTKEFIVNPGRNPDLSESPQQAVVSLKNDRGTSYGIYINVQNELKRAYNELRDQYAMDNFGTHFVDMEPETPNYKKVVDAFPQRISEAEPTNVYNAD